MAKKIDFSDKFDSVKRKLSSKKKNADLSDKTMFYSDKDVKKFQTDTSGHTTVMPKVSDSKSGIFDKAPVETNHIILEKRTKKPNFALGVVLNILKVGLAAIFVFVAVACGLVSGLANAYLETTPTLDVSAIESQDLTSYIYTQEGQLLATYTGTENRDYASIDEIPEELQKAFIAVEDIRFYSHNGVDIKRLAGSLLANLSSGSSQGGSTITQQLIKNTLLSSEPSYKRKIQEASLAMELEKRYSKDEILEAYLNCVPLGETVYGVKAAAKSYFGKDLSELSLKQMVCIAAITQYPWKYSPRRATYVTGEVGALQNRMNIVVERMYAAGFITKEQYDEVFVPKSEWEKDDYINTWKTEMQVLEKSPANEMYAYPHFIEYVVEDVSKHLCRKYGLEETDENLALMEQEIRTNGYNIYATIDTNIQETVQSTISEWNDYPSFTKSEYNEVVHSDGSVTIQPQAAAVVIEQSTGQLKAIVGSRDEPTAKKTLNLATDAQAGMPIGSSMKPIGVYTPAFDLGASPATPIANVPVAIPGWESETGYPTTSQGSYGPTAIRTGIVNSLNIVAARTLMEKVGIHNSVKYLTDMGVNINHINQDGVGLALGSSGVTPLEVTACYATIANGGYYLEPVSFTKVVDSNGNTVLDSSETRVEKRVFKESAAWMTVDCLTDAVDHGTGTRAKIDGITTAGKTGTVVDNRGVSFAGMTGYYTSCLWVGSTEYKPFASGTAASNSTCPIWRTYMTKIHEGLENRSILSSTPESLGLVQASVCQISGDLPNGSCPTFTDWFDPSTVPTKTCDVHTSATICSMSGMLASEYCPEDMRVTGSFLNLPETSPYRQFYAGGNQSGENETQTAEDGTQTPTKVFITSSNQVCTIHTPERANATATAQSAIQSARKMMDKYMGTITTDYVNEINSLIQQVQEKILTATATNDDILSAANRLTARANEIDAELAAIPTPTPEPTPEPEEPDDD